MLSGYKDEHFLYMLCASQPAPNGAHLLQTVWQMRFRRALSQPMADYSMAIISYSLMWPRVSLPHDRRDRMHFY